MDGKIAGLAALAAVLGVGAGIATYRATEGEAPNLAFAAAGVVFFGVVFGGRWTVVRAVALDPTTQAWAASQRQPRP